MIKAVLFPIPLIILMAATVVSAQSTSSYDANAINEAVMREANTIVLRQKLTAANAAVQQKDLDAAVRLYEDAYALARSIGPMSIPQEWSQTVSGLVAVHMELAREAERQGDLHTADVHVSRVLTVDPTNAEALAFKKQNDLLIAQTRGTQPDMATLQEAPAIQSQRTDAATLARDGQMLYEMGKLEEAEVRLEQALQLDPDNRGAYYYLTLVKQARFAREDRHKTEDNNDRMVQVMRAWEKPVNITTNFDNPYFLTNLVYTSSGRQSIYTKLNNIQLDAVNYPSLPLSEVLRDLRQKSLQRDPEKKGINFLFNPNIENIPSVAATTTPGGVPERFPGGGAPATINPANGLPENAPTPSQPADPTQINISLSLNNVSLAELLNAICLVADHPIKYSVEDYGIVFAQKGPDSPQYEMRTFKVDPNTFYAGLQNVDSFSFGSVNLQSSGGVGGAGGGGGGAQGGTGQSPSGAVVPVVDVAPGAAQARQVSGGAGGGAGAGAGATGGQGGAAQTGPGYLANPLGDLQARVQDNGGGLLFVTTPNLTRGISGLAAQFFSSLGVDLTPPKTVFFNDKLGVLFVYATPQDLDIIEKAIQVLNQSPPMVHIKARFIDVSQTDNNALGFDWYLGGFNIGGHSVMGQGGNMGSVTVPVSAANPEGVFPGNPTAGTTITPGVQSITTAGLATGAPALASITGILTNPNFQVVLHALENRSGTQELAEPEVTTISGRQTEMRATEVQPVITGYSFQAAPAAAGIGGIP
ncbi:MAG TPA: tetratricopeptide repeat protein [Verrucomicrobiae bacterium]|nr:tetratricopeptide repeat protein [Verrucomicrobiae bacterium]